MDSVSTGLCDSRGEEILVGDRIRKPVDGTVEVHGRWAEFQVIQRGLTPVLSYLRSEKGQVLPKGMSASPLCEEYDLEEFCRAEPLTAIRPVGELEVVRTQNQQGPGREPEPNVSEE